MKDLKTKELLDAPRMHPFLFASGIYVGVAMGQWLGYFLGYIPLEMVVFFTLGAPLVLFCLNSIKQTHYQVTFERVVIVAGGGLALGWPIWAFSNYLLYVPIWAPLHGSEGLLSTLAFVLITVLSYGAAAYLMDRLGKKRIYESINSHQTY